MALTKITSSVVAVNSLTAANIADNSIDATKIANNQILARHIAAGSLSDQIADNSIGISELNVSDGSNGQFLKTNGSGTLSFATVSGTTINNNADNRVITGSGTANTLEGEANFVFDGTNVSMTHAAGAHTNGLKIINSQAGGYGSAVTFQSERSDDNSIVSAAQIRTSGNDSWNSAASADSNLFFATALDGSLNDRMVIKHDGSVGIGTTSPTQRLEVRGGTGSGTNTHVVFTGTAGRGLAIQTQESGGQHNAGVVFDAQDTENGANPYHAFETAGTERIRFNSSGHIAVGHTSPNVISSTAPTLSMNNPNSSTLSGGISYSANGTIKAYHYFENDFLLHQTASGVGHKFYDGTGVGLRLDSDGLKFGTDTAAANALDDYEEGTWTPTFGGATLTTAVGKYTKIGDTVHVQYHFLMSGGMPTSTAQVQIGGLPFTSSSSYLSSGSIYARYYTPNDSTLTTIVMDSESVIRLVNINETSFDYTIFGELEASHNNAAYIIGQVTYTV